MQKRSVSGGQSSRGRPPERRAMNGNRVPSPKSVGDIPQSIPDCPVKLFSFFHHTTGHHVGTRYFLTCRPPGEKKLIPFKTLFYFLHPEKFLNVSDRVARRLQ
jgi:hypothetical protein